MATLRLFAAAREAAHISSETIDAPTVEAALNLARVRYGEHFAAILSQCRIWVNGEPAAGDLPVGAGDEIAVLPPVSGGCGR